VITSPELHEHIIDNRLILSQVINKAERYPNPNILPLLKNIMPDSKDGNGLPERLSRLIRNIESLLEEQGLDRRKDLVSSIKESPDRKLHLQAIMTQQVPPVVTDLVRLIRDQDIEIKRETIFIAGKFRINELLPEICECLHDPLIAADAYNVLRSFGKEAFEAMAGHFYRSSGSIMVRRLILRLFAETGGSEAIEFLLPRIWSVHRFLKKEAVKGLNKCGYKAQDESREKIFREIKSIIGMLAWNYEIQIILKDNNDDLLDEALEKETDWWTALLFDILALLYDRESLMMIRKSLEEGSVESISLAMETIDIVVDEEIKPPLIALLDVVPLEIKVKSLSVFYPGGKHDYETLVQQLVNKDYNHTGVWTKVCALRSLYNLPRPSETDFLVALLFGVHRILREEALRYLQEQFDDVYHSCSYRLPRIYRDQLDEMLRGHARDLELVHNKLKSLALVFPGIPENTLNKMAEDVSLVNREKTGLPEPGSDFIMWPAITADTIKRDNMIISWHTAGYATEPREIRALEGDHYMLYVSDIKKFVFFEPDKSDDVVKYMDGILLEAEKGESGRERNIVL
ncbi:MAG: hypothetical protein KFF49_04700, partial [Bacteroidales bacterium]|nr:hypothetical protein [Bacteroidales bacterium]